VNRAKRGVSGAAVPSGGWTAGVRWARGSNKASATHHRPRQTGGQAVATRRTRLWTGVGSHSFVAVRGRAAVVSKTPFRLTFAGGGTDLPQYYRDHGPGACVAGAMDKGIYVMVVENFNADEIRVSYRITEDAKHSIDEIAHGAIRESMRLLRIPSGVQVITATQMPSRGTGIGSSSSCAVGTLHALHAWKGERVGPRQLAKEAVRIEREILKEPGGIQDQYCAAYGGLNLIQVARDGEVSVHSLGIDHEGLGMLNRHLMLFFTGTERRAADIHVQQIGQIGEHLDDYVRMRNLALDTAKALENLDFPEVGRLMDENWQLKRRLSDGISNPEIDRAYEAAKKSGALGGKLLGAGGGGFLFLLVDPDRQANVRESLVSLGLAPKSANIEIAGSSIVHEE
jgi:D-glycero-alpha-D-manno-heptose-7-phosphate kinase